MKDHSPDSEVLALLRRQRHSFANHLQVISGWLQLSRTDRARQYLDTVAGRMTAEAETIRSLPPALGLAVIALSLEAETYGVELVWHVSGNIGADQAARAEELTELVQLALARCSGGTAGAARLAVHLGPDGFTVHTPTAVGEG